MSEERSQHGQTVAVIVAAIIGATGMILAAYIQRPVTTTVSKSPLESEREAGNPAVQTSAPVVVTTSDTNTVAAASAIPAPFSTSASGAAGDAGRDALVNSKGSATKTDATERSHAAVSKTESSGIQAKKRDDAPTADTDDARKREESVRKRLRQISSDDPSDDYVYLAVPGGGTQPEDVQRVAPSYPIAARQAGIAGQAIVRGIVRRDGSIDSLQIVKDPGSGLGEAALEAIKQWRFKPATYRGNVIEVYYTVTVNFRLPSP